MNVMTGHEFFDDDIEKVTWTGNEDLREIVLNSSAENSLIISKTDIIAFAKEFDLIVFDKGSKL